MEHFEVGSRQITGTFEFDDNGEGLKRFIQSDEQEYQIVLTLPYRWSIWDRFVNALYWHLGLVDYRLPPTYDVVIPKAKIFGLETAANRIRADFKMEGME